MHFNLRFRLQRRYGVDVFRGQPTGTMAYDNKPIFDHFARIDDNRILGIIDLKGCAWTIRILSRTRQHTIRDAVFRNLRQNFVLSRLRLLLASLAIAIHGSSGVGSCRSATRPIIVVRPTADFTNSGRRTIDKTASSYSLALACLLSKKPFSMSGGS